MKLLRRARHYLGTLVEVAFRHDLGEREAEIVADAAFRAIARVYTAMSYHDANSDVSKLNRAAAGSVMVVSQDMWRVLSHALELGFASDGLFDVAIAPVLVREELLPRDWQQPHADQRGTFADICFLSDCRVKLHHQVSIDLGGIAKGYAVDCAIQALRRAGVAAGSVNAGGDLRAFGEWSRTIGVRHPACPTTIVPLLRTHPAVATSADYFLAMEYGARRTSALVDPRNDQPHLGGQRSVTVFAATCLEADALTKVVALEPAVATPLLAAAGARALILEVDAGSRECRVFDSDVALRTVPARRVKAFTYSPPFAIGTVCG